MLRSGRYDATPALRCLSGTDAKASGRLFLFHYATGDAQSLMHMTAKLPPHVAEVWAFEYPAHGARECTQTSDDEPSTMPSVAELVEEQVCARHGGVRRLACHDGSPFSACRRSKRGGAPSHAVLV